MNSLRSKKLSLIIPVYNEAGNLVVLYDTLMELMRRLDITHYEIIFINDGSSDASWSLIAQLALFSGSIKGINFSRNFGHQAALNAGYHRAVGDVIISMDADMQHPPEVIPHMLQAWQQGFDIVYAENTMRKDYFLKKITALWYYWFMGIIAVVHIPRNVADFRLIDKKVITVLKQSRQRSCYLRGMVAWTGFKHTSIPCVFAKRVVGTTGYTWSKMFKLALDGIINFSEIPLLLVACVGVFLISIGVMSVVYMAVTSLLFHTYYGITWFFVIIQICLGMSCIILWYLSECIRKLYECFQEPLYVISEKLNLD